MTIGRQRAAQRARNVVSDLTPGRDVTAHVPFGDPEKAYLRTPGLKRRLLTYGIALLSFAIGLIGVGFGLLLLFVVVDAIRNIV